MSAVDIPSNEQRAGAIVEPATSLSTNEYAPPAERASNYHVANSVAVLMDRGGPRAESVGVLRAQVLTQHVRQGRRALAICATQGDVGCTTLSVNLAVALGQVGLKTLLIDGNLRQPGVDQLIAPGEPVPGLLQCLRDDTPLEEAIQDEVLPGLSVLYAGGASDTAQEFLARDRFKMIVDRCLRDFDITIIDTPPANSSADARRIASVAGYALVVVGKNRTYVHDVEVLAEELRSDRTTVIGSVLIDG